MAITALTKTSSGTSLTAAAPVAPAMLYSNSGTVLTVGAGMEFATLKDALAASVDGDTIAVKAGTYTNDFGTVSANVRVVAVGGMVNEVATIQPPNGKGILTVENTLSIQGFTFSGATDGGMWGNIAGIRLDNGSLNVSYCYFHDNQNGILAGTNPTATVTIDHSEFGHNGSGDGLTHNLYIGSVASLTVTNSYFHDAIVGHEIKSRALITTITNNVIADGPNGTASYDIDIPNAGVAKIANNIIEKGANASNCPAIHYGGETQNLYANNSLDVVNNTIINDLGESGIAVFNQSSVNGLTVSANLTGNRLYGFDPARIILGAGRETGDTTLTSEPTYSQASPWAAEPIVALGTAAPVLNLTNMNHTVTGGAGHLTVTDTGGSNTISGGAGGLALNETAQWDVITTQAGASDVLNIGAGGAEVNAAGNDRINVTANYADITATGQATITGSCFDHFSLNGVGEKLMDSGSAPVTIGSAADATIVDLAGYDPFTLSNGGTVFLSDLAATVNGGVAAGALVSNGAATGCVLSTGVISVTTGDGGARVQAGGGAVSVTGGAGADTLVGGSGNDAFILGGGADQVTFGSGSASVTGGTGHDTYIVHAGAHGTATITGFKQGVDALHMVGFTGTGIASGKIVGGSTVLSLTDGSTVDLVGVALPGYGAPGSGSSPGGSSGGSGGGTPPSTPPTGSGTVTLTTSGQTVMGTASALAVADLAGGNTIIGGAGGLTASAGTTDFLSTASGTTDQVTLYRYDTLSGAGADQVTASANGNAITESGTATVTLVGTGNLVHGGAGRLCVSDTAGGDSVFGGAGGIVATMAGSDDVVNTAAGATDTVCLGGHDALNSAGNDQVTIGGTGSQVSVTGATGITAATGSNTYTLDGTDTLAVGGGGAVTVGSQAQVTVASAGNDTVYMTKLAGGTLAASETVPGGIASLNAAGGAATVNAGVGVYSGLYASSAGGVAFAAGTGFVMVNSAAQSGGAGDTVNGGAGTLVVNATGSQGVDVMAGSGNVTLYGGAGNDVFVGGAGQARLYLGAGADTVTLGSGAITVQGGVADTFIVPGNANGSLVVQNWTAQDSLVTAGHQPPAITGESVLGGSLFLTTAGGAHIELVGVTHFS